MASPAKFDDSATASGTTHGATQTGTCPDSTNPSFAPSAENLRHELRTPVNAILGYSAVISNELAGACDLRRIRSAMDAIQKNGRHVSALVDAACEAAGQFERLPARNGARGDILANTRVLIVEDSADCRHLLERVLQLAGVEPTAVDNGLAAITALTIASRSKRPFDCILMDVQMPGMSGIDATRRIRDLGHRVPIVAISASLISEVRQKCSNAGCDSHLSKPFDRHALLDAIGAVMGGRREMRSGAVS
jgi:CheY-like chemotaxis protein